ncbi:hypothetical protein M8J76_005677 [Diaphorina citri]|nr:hypothetical protein M8J76_005677 [Diaphorina citri]
MFQNQYKYYKNPKVSILDPAYYFAKCFALLSISKISKNHNRILVSPFESNRGVEFYTISYLSFAYTSLSILVMAFTFQQCVLFINYPCVGMSDCAAWILTASHSILSIILLVTSMSRTKACIDCFNKARELLAWNPNDDSDFHWTALNFIFFLAILLARCLCAVLARSNASIHTRGAFYLYILCLIYPIAVECVVCSLCYVIQVALEKINQRLTFIHQLQFKESKVISLHIEEFMDLHWKSFELAFHTTKTFGVDLLFDLAFSMIWFVIYVYITIASLANLNTTEVSSSEEMTREIFRNAGLFLELMFVTLRIFYICHRAQQMSTPAQKSIKILRDLGRGNHLKDGCRKLIDAYSTQILERKMKLEACDFFTVDMSFIHGIVGVATTYLIVFIQYNTS